MPSMIRIAAVGDLHCKMNSAGSFQQLFSHVATDADILILLGDLERGSKDPDGPDPSM